MLTTPNIITLLRVPLVLFFLQDNPLLRTAALILAMLSDYLDGLIARRWGKVSSVGTFLDPLADKFFVVFVLSVFLLEDRLHLWQAVTMLCRDMSVVLFGFYLAWKGVLPTYQFRSIICGKITTTLQFGVLLSLLFHLQVPNLIYLSFIALGALALAELYSDRGRLKVEN
jgi:CDP-diacylglycerol---glycerol-3-phosphate 3-phosphatidyltransferase